MNRNYATEEYDDDDAQLNESISEVEPDDMSLADDDELRRARIAEYRHESLRKDDPLRACLGATNAGLFEIILSTEAAVKNALQSTERNSLESPHLQRALGTHANYTRQVHRYASLVVLMDKDERQADNAKFQRRTAGIPAPVESKYRRDRA
jgi:hypothetical protein